MGWDDMTWKTGFYGNLVVMCLKLHVPWTLCKITILHLMAFPSIYYTYMCEQHFVGYLTLKKKAPYKTGTFWYLTMLPVDMAIMD